MRRGQLFETEVSYNSGPLRCGICMLAPDRVAVQLCALEPRPWGTTYLGYAERADGDAPWTVTLDPAGDMEIWQVGDRAPGVRVKTSELVLGDEIRMAMHKGLEALAADEGVVLRKGILRLKNAVADLDRSIGRMAQRPPLRDDPRKVAAAWLSDEEIAGIVPEARGYSFVDTLSTSMGSLVVTIHAGPEVHLRSHPTGPLVVPDDEHVVLRDVNLNISQTGDVQHSGGQYRDGDVRFAHSLVAIVKERYREQLLEASRAWLSTALLEAQNIQDALRASQDALQRGRETLLRRVSEAQSRLDAHYEARRSDLGRSGPSSGP